MIAVAPGSGFAYFAREAASQSPLSGELLESEVEAWRSVKLAMQDEIAALSTRGERRSVDAGHGIQQEKPEVVIAAIEEVLATARAG